MSNSLLYFLDSIPDPRNKSGRRHSLSIVVLISIAAAISQIYSIRGIESYINRHRQELLRILPPSKHGLPSFSSLKRVLLHIDFGSLALALKNWFISQNLLEPNEWISIDGKAIGSTVLDACNKNQNFAVVVSAFSHISGIALLSAKYNQKENNEIAIAEALIQNLEVEERIFILDALHSKKNS